ncbi:hypothetical protein HaLaN_19852, partial [Haematococcus lacustris]
MEASQACHTLTEDLQVIGEELAQCDSDPPEETAPKQQGATTVQQGADILKALNAAAAQIKAMHDLYARMAGLESQLAAIHQEAAGCPSTPAPSLTPAPQPSAFTPPSAPAGPRSLLTPPRHREALAKSVTERLRSLSQQGGRQLSLPLPDQGAASCSYPVAAALRAGAGAAGQREGEQEAPHLLALLHRSSQQLEEHEQVLGSLSNAIEAARIHHLASARLSRLSSKAQEACTEEQPEVQPGQGLPGFTHAEALQLQVAALQGAQPLLQHWAELSTEAAEAALQLQDLKRDQQ